MRSKAFIIVASAILLMILAGAIGFVILAPRGHHKVALTINMARLNSVMDEWRKAGRPSGDVLHQLASTNTFKPFVHTNVVVLDGYPHHCLFGIRDSRFAKEGALVVTRDGVFIWMGKEEGPVKLEVKK
jgi:hypothetical protein